MRTRDVLAIFNRGRISKLALARTDVSRVALSAAIMTNFIPRTLGSMSLRPGWKYHGSYLDDGALVPFIFSNSDTANLELSPSVVRVWTGGDTLLSRASVATTITNGDFATDLSGWTNADDSGAASTWVSGALQMLGTGSGSARMRQQITPAGADLGVEHALRIVVDRGPILLRVGTTAGADDIFSQAVLRTGTHSIAFTPSTAFWIELSSPLTYPTLVASCDMEASGVLSLPTPWTTVDLCKCVRWEQSSDVLYLSCRGVQQRRIERRANNSWSIVEYAPDNGPFLTENTDSTTITPSATSGAITLTSSAPIFASGNVGGIFSLSSQGQEVSASASAELVYTDEIRVTGVGNTRIFQIIRSGTWSGTVTLQRSVGAVGAWEDIRTYTTNGTTSYDDNLDNSVVFYRVGFNAGDYTSGLVDLKLDYGVGSITGTVRVTGFTSESEVSGVVLRPLGGAQATEVWAEGIWSDRRGWPSSVAISEGRLWWSGNGRNYGSVSDAFENFDPDFEGDAAPINRRVGEGASDNSNWILPLQRLLVGTDSAEYSVRSNSFDEPITPTNYNTKEPSSKGSAGVPAVHADGRGYFVGRTTRKVFEMQYDGSTFDFAGLDLTVLVPEIGDAGFVRIAVQKNPDMRLHCVRADGTVAILIRDEAEDVLCWLDVETDGAVEDVSVLPGATGDRVFYRVRRTINGATVRYNEEWAQEEDCVGRTLNLQADSYVTGTGSITGLDHLEGKTVVIWADGVDQGTATVSSGSVSGSYTSWVAGLPYEARYKSAKIARVSREVGAMLGMRCTIAGIGFVLADTHARGLQYGQSFDVMDDLPLMENGAAVDANAIWDEYDEGEMEFPGEWSNDARLHLKAAAPRPCTVSAAVLTVEWENGR